MPRGGCRGCVDLPLVVVGGSGQGQQLAKLTLRLLPRRFLVPAVVTWRVGGEECVVV
jgi:hypothetical protein